MLSLQRGIHVVNPVMCMCRNSALTYFQGVDGLFYRTSIRQEVVRQDAISHTWYSTKVNLKIPWVATCKSKQQLTFRQSCSSSIDTFCHLTFFLVSHDDDIIGCHSMSQSYHTYFIRCSKSPEQGASLMSKMRQCFLCNGRHEKGTCATVDSAQRQP